MFVLITSVPIADLRSSLHGASSVQAPGAAGTERRISGVPGVTTPDEREEEMMRR
jgi:hypothetical protein